MDHVLIGVPVPRRIRNFRLLFAARAISCFATNLAPIPVDRVRPPADAAPATQA
jgi:hypothetical protein